MYTGAKLVLLVALLPVVLAIRLLRPLLHLRFGALISNRIGHFAGNTEVYLCERDAGLHPEGCVDIFFHTPPVANRQLQRMIERVLPVCRVARLLDWANRRLPGGADHVVDIARNGARDADGLSEACPPHLAFTAQELARGARELETLGVPRGGEYVCLNARDPSYLAAQVQGQDMGYHDHRDTRIATLEPAARELAGRGLVVFRMGARVASPFPVEDPRVVDYARGGRSPFMDVFLGATCRFTVCDTSGFYALAFAFRRPVAFYNFVPLAHVHTWSRHDLVIPKRIRRIHDGSELSVAEILGSEVGTFLRDEQYRGRGLEVVDNTPDEIRELVAEMDDRLAGRWRPEPEDEELQQRFWSHLAPGPLSRVFRSRVGAGFLRRHRQLLAPPRSG